MTTEPTSLIIPNSGALADLATSQPDPWDDPRITHRLQVERVKPMLITLDMPPWTDPTEGGAAMAARDCTGRVL